MLSAWNSQIIKLLWLLGQDSQNHFRLQNIAVAARELHEKRERWLHPSVHQGGVDVGSNPSQPSLSTSTPPGEKSRTLTNLYNQRPTWLALAHEKLDKAVFAAYGWPHDLSEEEVLGRLLEENLRRGGLLIPCGATQVDSSTLDLTQFLASHLTLLENPIRLPRLARPPWRMENRRCRVGRRGVTQVRRTH